MASLSSGTNVELTTDRLRFYSETSDVAVWYPKDQEIDLFDGATAGEVKWSDAQVLDV